MSEFFEAHKKLRHPPKKKRSKADSFCVPIVGGSPKSSKGAEEIYIGIAEVMVVGHVF